MNDKGCTKGLICAGISQGRRHKKRKREVRVGCDREGRAFGTDVAQVGGLRKKGRSEKDMYWI
jgi:hypothetical protein